jgi:hypothetical protein
MTVPQLQIIDAIEDRLKLIKTSNEHTFTVSRVKRATLKPFIDDDLPAINYWPEGDQQIEKKYNWVDRTLSVVIECYDRTRDKVFTDVAFELSSAVMTTLLRSVADPKVSDDPDPTLGGLIKSIEFVTITPQIGEGQTPWCGVILNCAFNYRVAANNPMTII